MKGLFVAIAVLGLAAFSSSVRAEDAAIDGAKLFTTHCNVCHPGGNNVLAKEKTLQKDALKAAGLSEKTDLVKFITDGKAAMPAFKEKLKPAEVEAVAAYILEQAGKDWK